MCVASTTFNKSTKVKKLFYKYNLSIKLPFFRREFFFCRLAYCLLRLTNKKRTKCNFWFLFKLRPRAEIDNEQSLMFFYEFLYGISERERDSLNKLSDCYWTSLFPAFCKCNEPPAIK